jgi:hypothetical protein
MSDPPPVMYDERGEDAILARKNTANANIFSPIATF